MLVCCNTSVLPVPLHGFTINCDVFQTATNQYRYCVAIWAFIPIELNKKKQSIGPCGKYYSWRDKKKIPVYPKKIKFLNNIQFKNKCYQ